jgi:hypothetical protein
MNVELKVPKKIVLHPQESFWMGEIQVDETAWKSETDFNGPVRA